jgi:hypothetical protein
VEIQLHAFLTSALDGGEWSASRPGRFTPRERAPGTHWIGGRVGSRAVLDTVVKRKIPSLRRESNRWKIEICKDKGLDAFAEFSTQLSVVFYRDFRRLRSETSTFINRQMQMNDTSHKLNAKLLDICRVSYRINVNICHRFWSLKCQDTKHVVRLGRSFRHLTSAPQTEENCDRPHAIHTYFSFHFSM